MGSGSGELKLSARWKQERGHEEALKYYNSRPNGEQDFPKLTTTPNIYMSMPAGLVRILSCAIAMCHISVLAFSYSSIGGSIFSDGLALLADPSLSDRDFLSGNIFLGQFAQISIFSLGNHHSKNRKKI